MLRAIEEGERTRLFHRQVDGLLQQVSIVVTVEHKAVGVVVIQEQDQLEIGWILGEMVLNLTAQGLVAPEPPTGMDFLQEDVAIGKVQDTV